MRTYSKMEPIFPFGPILPYGVHIPILSLHSHLSLYSRTMEPIIPYGPMFPHGPKFHLSQYSHFSSLLFSYIYGYAGWEARVYVDQFLSLIVCLYVVFHVCFRLSIEFYFSFPYSVVISSANLIQQVNSLSTTSGNECPAYFPVDLSDYLRFLFHTELRLTLFRYFSNYFAIQMTK